MASFTYEVYEKEDGKIRHHFDETVNRKLDTIRKIKKVFCGVTGWNTKDLQHQDELYYDHAEFYTIAGDLAGGISLK